MKVLQYFCDVCGKEFQPNEYAFLNGQIVKVTPDLQSQPLTFEGHYCGEDTHKILEYIQELKHAKNFHTGESVEHTDSTRADK